MPDGNLRFHPALFDINQLLNPAFKEFPRTQHLVYSLPVVTAAGNFMGSAGMTHIFDRTAQNLQTFIKLLALALMPVI